MIKESMSTLGDGTVERPIYNKFLEKGPPEHATPIFGISCDEGWRQSIVCTGMYEWAADWLVGELQGKPFAPGTNP
jgi:hypothetical protein